MCNPLFSLNRLLVVLSLYRWQSNSHQFRGYDLVWLSYYEFLKLILLTFQNQIQVGTSWELSTWSSQEMHGNGNAFIQHILYMFMFNCALQFNSGEIGHRHVKAPTAAVISPFMISPHTHSWIHVNRIDHNSGDHIPYCMVICFDIDVISYVCFQCTMGHWNWTTDHHI